MKKILSKDEWSNVAAELEHEELKLKSYDNTLLQNLELGESTNVLDYGAGPGVLALALKKMGCRVKTFDISPEMSLLSGQKIGLENVYAAAEHIPQNSFDYVICNLVLCINDEDEVKFISGKIKRALKNGGEAFVGFCNPEIFNVQDSALDVREQTGKRYEENHVYRKVKKEGLYEILESHRPLEWYGKTFRQVGLKVKEKIFTPEYEFNGKKIQDFVIFRLSKSGDGEGEA